METVQKLYSKNYLVDVICRIDFPLVLELIDVPPKEFQNSIISDFPILKPTQQFGVSIKKDEEGISTQEKSRIIWTFHDKEESYIVELFSEFLVINCKKYIDFADFEKKLKIVFDSFFKVYPNIIINRLGLRYINQIEIEGEDDFFDWSAYINQKLVEGIDFVENKQNIRREFNNLVLDIKENVVLNFKYGIFNRYYPDEIVKKEFMLDYDCYTKNDIEIVQIYEQLSSFNQIITEYFEKSIKDGLRNKLNA